MNLEQLHCIDLDQPTLEGFRRFISAWCYHSDSLSFVVDPGPLSTIPVLVERLQALGVTRLDFILLTHIHIDHAGGSGALLQAFPGAKVVCHPDGVRHLAAPEKLWQGSVQVLGKSMTDLYGEIVAVPKESLVAAGDDLRLAGSGLRSYLTPGHAPHHCCYLLDGLLFGGEVAGVHYPVDGGIYMRPATPPRFLLEVALDSIGRMIDLAPEFLVIAHHGLVTPAVDYLEIGRRQFRLWVQGAAVVADLPADAREAACFDWLQQRDPNFGLFDRLPADIQARERIFFGNTLRGLLGYVEELNIEERDLLRA